ITVLYTRTKREAWEKIGTSCKVSSDKIKDDKKAPSDPSSLKKSGSSLSWGKSSSSDVVGYRIFKKNGDKYSLVGHTTDRSYKVSDKDAGYSVKAVDYFGRESEGSNAIKPSKEKEEKVDNKNKEEKEKKKIEEQKEKEEKAKKEKEKQQEKEKKDDKKKDDKKKDEDKKDKNDDDKDE